MLDAAEGDSHGGVGVAHDRDRVVDRGQIGRRELVGTDPDDVDADGWHAGSRLRDAPAGARRLGGCNQGARHPAVTLASRLRSSRTSRGDVPARAGDCAHELRKGGTGMRPLIGITTYREQARWGYWSAPAVLLPASYAPTRWPAAAAQPVLLPTGRRSPQGWSPGSTAWSSPLRADIDPARYGQAAGAAHHGGRGPRPGRRRARRPPGAALEPRPAAARGVPGHATAQRRPRRRSRAAPARRSRTTTTTPGTACSPAGRSGRRPGAGCTDCSAPIRAGRVSPPPGAGPGGRRPHADGVGRGRGA